MIQPGRKYEAESSYRYGFNGKENDNEVKGEGNQQDYGMRIYDPRLGRFLSVDPLMKDYPGLSSYLYADNNPILNLDVEGGFKVPIHQQIIKEALAALKFNLTYDHLAVWTWQQTWDLSHAGDENRHFDNKFSSSEVYARWATLNEEVKQAKLGNPKDLNGGVDDDIQLGKVLHAVQDFYSHSNYVELFIEYYKRSHPGVSPDPDDIPTYDEGIKDATFKKDYLDPRLKTGAFHLGRWLLGKDKKESNKEGHVHHDDLNKDNDSTPEGGKTENGKKLFSYARRVAFKHTKNILEEKKKELEKKNL